MTHQGQTWETQELLRWLNSDERQLGAVSGMNAEELRAYVHAGKAPDGFYALFAKDPPSSYNDVDWEDIATRINDN